MAIWRLCVGRWSCVHAGAREASGGGVRALARGIFSRPRSFKSDFVLKNTGNGQYGYWVCWGNRRCVAQLSVRGAHFLPGRWSPCLLALLGLGTLLWFLAPPNFWYNNNRKRSRYEHRRRANKTNPTTQQPCRARLVKGRATCGDSNGGCRDETQNPLLCVGGKHTPLVGPRCHFR